MRLKDARFAQLVILILVVLGAVMNGVQHYSTQGGATMPYRSPTQSAAPHDFVNRHGNARR